MPPAGAPRGRSIALPLSDAVAEDPSAAAPLLPSLSSAPVPAESACVLSSPVALAELVSGPFPGSVPGL